jgi:hypothetical protein
MLYWKYPLLLDTIFSSHMCATFLFCSQDCDREGDDGSDASPDQRKCPSQSDFITSPRTPLKPKSFCSYVIPQDHKKVSSYSALAMHYVVGGFSYFIWTPAHISYFTEDFYKLIFTYLSLLAVVWWRGREWQRYCAAYAPSFQYFY